MTAYFGCEWNEWLGKDGVGRSIHFPIKMRCFLKWSTPNSFVKHADGTLRQKRRIFIEMVRVYIRKVNC